MICVNSLFDSYYLTLFQLVTYYQANGNESDGDSDDEISLEDDLTDDSDLSSVEEQIVAAVTFESLNPTEVSLSNMICYIICIVS